MHCTETMVRIGTLEVLSNALRLRADTRARDRTGRRIRLLIIWLGGVMRGAIGAGGSEAIQEAGLGNVALVQTGVSAGGPTALALAQHKAHLTVPVYEELADLGILGLVNRQFKFDLDALTDRLEPILCDDVVRGIRQRVYVVATRPDDGTPDLIDVKRAYPGCKAAIAASMAMPRFYRFVEVNGFKWCDGAWADFRKALNILLEKVRPTDVLVFSNSPRNPDMFERMGLMYGNWMTPPTTRVLQDRESRMDSDLELALDELSAHPIRSLIFRPKATNGFFPWTTHPRIVRDNAYAMKSFVEGSLEDAVREYS
jgi:predicted patatin/cPLA2 family phospholipase